MSEKTGRKIYVKKNEGEICKYYKRRKRMGVIEVVLIILVLVGLALVFKNQISSVANGVYMSIKEQVNSF